MTKVAVMETETFDLAERDVLAVLPVRSQDLARLRVLVQQRPAPTVTVVGKYNHGKSRLLNELLGSDAFAVADKRETVALDEHVQPDVRWLDAPGLDADVGLADDGHAYHAAWLQADIRLFVHAAKEGELDAAERALLHTLDADQQRTRRRTLFVLTQVDQMAGDDHLEKVMTAILAQASALPLYQVSSTRHRQGIEGSKKLLIEKSGIPALQAVLHEAIAEVPMTRAHETALLLSDIRGELESAQADAQSRLQSLQATQHQQHHAFELGLIEVLDKVQIDLQPVLQVSGPDQALVPDSFENAFKLTAGKQERARIQIAYSRACIAINAHLVKHGVVGLPLAQRTSVSSLDTVMVAVMGVSVKYREDLRKIFCEPEGRDRLCRDFVHYFELSEDRQALASQIAQCEAQRVAIEKALQALVKLETA